MPDNTPPLVWIDLYQTKPNRVFRRPQTWRWRALNAGNGRVLGNSADAYTNKADAVSAIQQLFGTSSNIYLRQTEQGNQVLRMADKPL